MSQISTTRGIRVMHAVITSPLLMAGVLVVVGVGVAQAVVSAHVTWCWRSGRHWYYNWWYVRPCLTEYMIMSTCTVTHWAHVLMQFNPKVSHDPVTTRQHCTTSHLPHRCSTQADSHNSNSNAVFIICSFVHTMPCCLPGCMVTLWE